MTSSGNIPHAQTGALSSQVSSTVTDLTRAEDALRGIGPAIAVYGSARISVGDPRYKLAYRVGQLLGAQGLAIVTGGGPGIMEAANRGVKNSGALSVGLGIEIPQEVTSNEYLDVGLTFDYFYTRKVAMVKHVLGAVVFPGGFGTMDELFEVLTLVQTGKLLNFPIILVGTDYWHGLMTWMDQTMLGEQMVSPGYNGLFSVVDDAEGVVRALHAAHVLSQES
ncbi:TIGR00730 family Rossman fold protein [Arcanobacterium buesumense]|uniref:Cytokinin riboside 5'-monophosphate phosphoribohydrolase n=1 Tax=Arcanobacterium buesumense TaxID=2722751 RepID=A0A6H2EM96_9ACTO|nr:TIGR00730 family Rossman fold protein [Arcanobacterium buesumense]QJC22194.1 TIGR00730 family Rossman fold protein [Arcanobacterium buesumense]